MRSTKTRIVETTGDTWPGRCQTGSCRGGFLEGIRVGHIECTMKWPSDVNGKWLSDAISLDLIPSPPLIIDTFVGPPLLNSRRRRRGNCCWIDETILHIRTGFKLSVLICLKNIDSLSLHCSSRFPWSRLSISKWEPECVTGAWSP